MQPAGLPGRKLTMGPPQPDTPTRLRRDLSPPPGLSARGHPRQGRLRRRPAGRADARSLTRASRAHEQPAARVRDTRGQFTMPANHSADAKLQAEPPLTPARSFRDVRSPGAFLPVLVVLRSRPPLDAVPEAYHNPAAVWWGALAPSPVMSSWTRRCPSPPTITGKAAPSMFPDHAWISVTDGHQTVCSWLVVELDWPGSLKSGRSYRPVKLCENCERLLLMAAAIAALALPSTCRFSGN
jgi:hypothetical protein